MNDLWVNYKATVAELFPDIQFVQRHAEWTNKKGVNLTADLYKGQHFIKSRQIEIWDNKSCTIHNNIIYPKTGANLPCFGMDLMGMSEKRVVLVFDFQHPVEHYLFSTDKLPKATGTYRFFALAIISQRISTLDIANHMRLTNTYLCSEDILKFIKR